MTDPASRWRPLAEKALRGKPLGSLDITTTDGIALDPVYFDDGNLAVEPPVRVGPWDVRALVDSGGIEEARLDLQRGADSLWIAAGHELSEDDLTGLAADGVALDIDATAGAVSGLDAHNRGADAATELAILAEGFAALAPDAMPVVRVAIDCDVFGAIAKLRALRILVPDAYVHAVQSARWLAAKDVWTNMIRGTAACFSAAVGGADAITTLPWDRALGVPSSHARRVSLTLHAVAAREAHLAEVADPAAGSYLVERWTDALIAAATARIDDPGLRSYDDTTGPTLGVSIYPNPADEAAAGVQS